jgi:hypothetical protein
MNPKVSKLLNQITNAKDELSLIRAKRPHESYYVGMWSDRPGRTYPSLICESCNTNLPGDLTEKEQVLCRIESGGLYSDTGTSGLFDPPRSLESYEGKMVAYTYEDGVIVSGNDFLEFYEKYKNLDNHTKQRVNITKIVRRADV